MRDSQGGRGGVERQTDSHGGRGVPQSTVSHLPFPNLHLVHQNGVDDLDLVVQQAVDADGGFLHHHFVAQTGVLPDEAVWTHLWLHTHTHTHSETHAHPQSHIHTNTDTHTHFTYRYKCNHIHQPTQTHTHTHTHTCMHTQYTHMHAHTHAHTFMCTRAHTHTHTHIHRANFKVRISCFGGFQKVEFRHEAEKVSPMVMSYTWLLT